MLQNKSLHYKAGGNSMSNKIESRKKLIKILTEMFQFDQADLDFGIYRIMNQKRDRIEEFMSQPVVVEGLFSTCFPRLDFYQKPSRLVS